MDRLKLNKNDTEVLASIADYRVLTAKQIAHLHDRDVHAVRRRLRLFETEGLIQVMSGGLGKTQGRPEGLISLGTAGVAALKDKGILRPDAPADQVLDDGTGFLEHHLLVNEFRVQMARIDLVSRSLSMRFCSQTSALLNQAGPEVPNIEERFEVGSGQEIRFIPDGVFALTHRESGRTVHFYLEVDMGDRNPSPVREAPSRMCGRRSSTTRLAFAASTTSVTNGPGRAGLRGFRVLFPGLLFGSRDRPASAGQGTCRPQTSYGLPTAQTS